MIEFKIIRWKNLLSTGNAFTEIPLTSDATTLILGENGSGKSTVLDALCFALFGRAYRDVNKNQIINSINNKKCVVEVEFAIGPKAYKVCRGIKPNVFEIYVNGELINQDASSRDYQKFLEETVLKLNFKSFTQIVILGSASFTPFMQLAAKERRDIIEDILDIRIFTLMNTLLKNRVRENNDLIAQATRDVDLAKTKVDMQKKYISTLENDRAERIAEIDANIKTYKASIIHDDRKIGDCLELLATVTPDIEELESIELDISANTTSAKEVKRDIAAVLKERDFYDENNTCPTCKQTITEKFKDGVFNECQDRLTDLEKTLDNIERTNAKLRERIPKLKLSVGKAKEYEYELQLYKTSKYSNEQLIKSLASEKTKLEGKTGNVAAETKKLKELAQDVVTCMKRKGDLTEDHHYLEVIGVMLKDSGIKTRVIKQYLPVINKLVNKYLASMDFFVEFTLDEEFKEVIKSRHRDEFSYASFSEGEKQKINLALLFTWRTIAKMKNSASTNLLILDEVFDSSLDANATEYLMGLLHTLSTDSHVFVISHKADLLSDKFAKILRFEKKQNFSSLTGDM